MQPDAFDVGTLRDSLRFSVTESPSGLCFEWLCLDGLPNGEKVNGVLKSYFAGRRIGDVDTDEVRTILQREVGSLAEPLTVLVDEYCRYLKAL
jgi:hypothetical protein